jgi:rubrerythrin
MTKQEAIEILTEMRDWNDYITQSDALQMAIDELEKKPAANSEDTISRQAMLDGLEKYHEGADLHIDGLTYAYDLVCKLPSVSTEKPNRCDLISREWLKTAIHNFYYGLKHTPTEEDIQAYIDVAPSISTEKTGRWKWVQYDRNPNIGNWHCSECNRIVSGTITAASPVYSYKYCPNCGAKMGVEE